MKKFFKENALNSLDILHNNSFVCPTELGEVAVCGTRGWFFEEESGSQHDRKIFLRELGRLETSLISAGDKQKYAFLHYPPVYKDYICSEILELFRKYEVTRCYYGHIHGSGHRSAFEGVMDGVEYIMTSADWLNFKPLPVG
jgi:predicted phosphohydrolase